jgi:hypothetical protein
VNANLGESFSVAEFLSHVGSVTRDAKAEVVHTDPLALRMGMLLEQHMR